MSTEVSLKDEDEFYAGIADVRSDSSDTNWALFGHWDNDPNVIYLVGSGSGGPDEMVEQINDSQVMYGLVRLEETFDLSTTVKFAYIHWTGRDVPFTKRGKYGVVHGSIEKYFDPYHLLIDSDNTEELTLENIRAKVQEASGTKSKVLDVAEAKSRPERGFTSGTTTKADSTGTTPTQKAQLSKLGKLGSSFTGVTSQAKGGAGIAFEDDVDETIRAVQSDASELNWCAVGYRDGNVKKPQICVLGAGEGGMDELKQQLADDNIVYGLLRVTDVVDDIPTVKFAFIQWVGESTKPLTKAKIPPHKGSIEDRFFPIHASIYATTQSEVSQRAVMDKITSASGSKSHVR